MSDIATNLLSRPALAHGLDVVPIATMTDFPAPSSGVITLEAGKLYLIQTALVTADRFELPGGSQIEILGTGRTTSSITYVGTGTFFSNVVGTTINRIDFNKIVLVIANPAAKALDITADASASSTFAFRVGTIFFVSGGEIGIVRNFGIINITALSVAGVSVDGLEVNNCVGMGITVSAFQGSLSGSATLIKVTGPSTAVLGLTDFGAVPIGAASVIFISPDIGSAQINLAQVFNIGNGKFFKQNDLGSFTGITNGFILNNCNAVTDDSGFASFDFGSAHLLSAGDQVTHTGFTNSQFNGEVIITPIDANSYVAKTLGETSLLFAAEATPGNSTLQYRVFATSDTVNISNTTPINIKNTAQNNGGFIVRKVITNVSFAVPAAFNISESGDWDTDSLDETAVQVNLTNTGNQKESKQIALGSVNDNTTPTPIAADVYQEVVLNGFMQNIVTERFILTDAANGIFQYIGATPFQGFLTGALAAVKQGSAENYRFAMSFNSGVPLFSSITSTAITSVSDSAGTARFAHAVTSPVLSIGSFAAITGFTGINVRYNQTGLVTFSNGTSFEIDGIDFIATGTGNFTATEANYIPMEVKSTKVVVPLLFSAQLRPGDTIQLMAAGVGTPTNLTVTDLGFGVF